MEDAAKDGYLLREHARLMPPGTNGVSIGLRFSGVAILEFLVLIIKLKCLKYFFFLFNIIFFFFSGVFCLSSEHK